MQLRFVFQSDGDGTREGVAVDNIRVYEAPEVDIAAVEARATLGGLDCPGTIDTLRFTYVDLGRQRSDSTLISYRIPGGQIFTRSVATPATRGDRLTAVFSPTELSYTPGEIAVIEVWVTTEGDETLSNDTTTLIFRPTAPAPFFVDLENGRRPQNWRLDEDLSLGDRGAGLTTTLFDRLDATDTLASFTTGSYGPFQGGDSLLLDVTLTPATPGGTAAGQLLVGFDIDCDDDAFLPDTFALVAGTQRIVVPVTFVGTGRFTVSASFGEGDFFIDFDNIGLRRCPAGLDIGLTIDPPTGIFADNGAAFLTPRNGTAPFDYVWSTGDTTASVDSLSVLDYSVTVTDAVGCRVTLPVRVGLQPVGTDEPGALVEGLSVFPNPTFGGVEVKIDLPGRLELSLEVYDARGRRIEIRQLGITDAVSTTLSLDRQPAGLYFLRVRAGAQARTVRLVKR